MSGARFDSTRQLSQLIGYPTTLLRDSVKQALRSRSLRKIRTTARAASAHQSRRRVDSYSARTALTAVINTSTEKGFVRTFFAPRSFAICR